MDKKQPIVAIIICLVIGIGSYVGLRFGFQRYELLTKNGIQVEASIERVYDKRLPRGNNSPQSRPWIDYVFTTEEGRSADGGHFVSDAEKLELLKNTRVKITYLPSDPEISQLTQSLEWGAGGTALVVVACVVIGLCLLGIVGNVKRLF